jgi:uncharacterized protein (TIGR00290 family)
MRVAVLWTGGKDSALALHKARITGYEVTNLLTFVPENADFLAHPLSFMRYQARAMGIPHNKEIVKAPLEAAYENAIRSFAEKHKLDALVTGDMAQVDGQPNWIRQRGASCGIKVLTPLWGMDRRRIMEELISNGFRAVINKRY